MVSVDVLVSTFASASACLVGRLRWRLLRRLDLLNAPQISFRPYYLLPDFLSFRHGRGQCAHKRGISQALVCYQPLRLRVLVRLSRRQTRRRRRVRRGLPRTGQRLWPSLHR